MASFDLALPVVLSHEGGIVDDPDDRGGLTMLGLIKDDLTQYLGREASEEDVKAVTREKARAIYKKLFWDHQNLDRVVSEKIALCLFDQSVVAGKGFTGRTAQICLGFRGTQIDGGLGEASLFRLNSCDEKSFLTAFLLACRAHYFQIARDDSTQKKFLLGWLNRVNDLYERVGLA